MQYYSTISNSNLGALTLAPAKSFITFLSPEVTLVVVIVPDTLLFNASTPENRVSSGHQGSLWDRSFWPLAPKVCFIQAHVCVCVCVCVPGGSHSPALEQELRGLLGPAVHSLTEQRETLLVSCLAHTHLHTQAHTHTHTCTRKHTHTHAHASTNTHTSTHTHASTHTH